MSHYYTMDSEAEMLVNSVMEAMIDKGLKVATAESCTGGMLASTLINYPGASSAFVDGFITYTNESKSRLLDIDSAIIDEYGAVSYQTAEQMCIGTALKSGADIGLSTTGIAGPGGGTAEKPVGLVYIGVYYKGEAFTERLLLSGDRQEIRSKAVVCVLQLLNKLLSEKCQNLCTLFS